MPLIALVGLWGFVASTTFSKAASEYRLNHVGLGLYKDTQVLLLAFEKERATTFILQSSPLPLQVDKLAPSRKASDVAIAAFQQSGNVSKTIAQSSASQLASIPGIREEVDSGRLSPAAAFEQYSNVINAILTVFIVPAQPDTTIYEESLASLDAARTQEQLARQQVLIEGVELDHTQLNPADRIAFADAAANQALELEDAIALSNGPNKTRLLQLASSPGYAELTNLQNQISGAASSGKASFSNALVAWTSVSKKEYNQLQNIVDLYKVPLINASGNLGRSLVLQAVLSGGLGLIALILSVFLAIRFGRRVRAELTGLRDGAQTMAHERLPRVIKELRDGNEVDVAAESPPLPTGKITEVARVADAFSTVQRTAIDAAVGQANLRKGVSQVFLNLSLRNQSLLHRQLAMLDTLERTTDDPNALGDLFRLDHLTTRMRRNAESLIILSGSTPGRGWRDPVKVLDVLRAAIAEVEDYVRVDVVGESPDMVVGIAVNDVVHLIAELVENATAFSPPNTQVYLRAETVGYGVAVEVEDRGLGPAKEDLEVINSRLETPPEFDLPGSGQLGMYVVGQLAARHGIKVSLRPSPYGGTTAIVLLPHAIIVPREDGPGTAVQPMTPASRGRRELDVPDASDSWSAALVSAPGRHRLEGAGSNGHGEPVTEPSLPAVPARPSLPAGPSGLPGNGNGSQDHQRGPWDPPATQEPTRVDLPWEAPAAGGTHLGLPLRVRQANLAPQLRRQNTEEASTTPAAPEGPSRSPEETFTMMTAFQDGWRRGRTDDLDELAPEPNGGHGSVQSDVQHAHDGEGS